MPGGEGEYQKRQELDALFRNDNFQGEIEDCGEIESENGNGYPD